MSNVKNSRVPLIFTSLLYFCGLFLFLEWLYPVKQLTDDTNLSVFIIYTLFCFIISLLQIRWYFSFLLKGFGLIFIIHGLYFEQGLLSKLWFHELFSELAINTQALLSQHWYDFTSVFRSVLLLLLIWLMSYLIHYWFIVIKRIFLFVVLTFIYISILDTFTVYDAGFSIIRTFIISFVALGMSNFFKEIQKEAIHFPWTKRNPIWLIPLVSIVLFSTFIGYAAPKFDPQWPDPVPYLQNVAGKSGHGGPVIQKVGYGEDDSRLGGSFVQDYTPVFQAAVKAEHYWRIETKDVYTGKGWERSTVSFDHIIETDGYIPITPFSNQVETKELEAILDFNEKTDFRKLLYPYGIKTVNAQGVQFMTDIYSEEVRTQINGSDVRLDHYSLMYDHPSFEINKLREAGSDPDEIVEDFTQLPENLPDRVHELADSLTASYDNRYDKAKAIETYFGKKDNGFVYQISDVAVPAADQDYVDQFLFESKAGYCDNFSTSMVVLLRTLDIPARWAKGFTSGEKMESAGSGGHGFDVYEVTNANAHSWVEVYFPDVGWVPFEPTQGFSNLTDFHIDTDSVNADDRLEAPTPEIDRDEKEQQPMPKEEEAKNAAAKAGGKSSFKLTKWHVIIGAIGLIILSIVIYRTRYRWQAYLLAIKMDRKQDAETYQDAYHYVLKLLNHEGHNKDAAQTLREYAKHIDVLYSTQTMGQLTSYYEQILYNKEKKEMETTEITQLWKKLIKCIIG